MKKDKTDLRTLNSANKQLNNPPEESVHHLVEQTRTHLQPVSETLSGINPKEKHNQFYPELAISFYENEDTQVIDQLNSLGYRLAGRPIPKNSIPYSLEVRAWNEDKIIHTMVPPFPDVSDAIKKLRENGVDAIALFLPTSSTSKKDWIWIIVEQHS